MAQMLQRFAARLFNRGAAARSAAANLELEEISMAMHDRLPTTLELGEMRRLAALGVEELDDDAVLAPEDYHDVGSALFHGEGGVGHDAEKAAAVWWIGSERGCVGSRYSYAMSLSAGHGIERDAPRAFAMLEGIVDAVDADLWAVAAESGEAERAERLNLFGSKGGAARAAAVAAAEADAAAAMAADSADAAAAKRRKELRWRVGGSALLAAARMLETGSGPERDGLRAIALYQRAVAAGKSEACYSLAQLYQGGVPDTVAVDEATAVKWLRVSKKLGDANGAFALGLAYCEGKGVAQDWRKGFEHTRDAAQSGLPHAMYSLGNHYYLGKGVGQDYGMAVAEYRKAAELGFVFAQINLAVAHMKGTGVPKVDLVEARKWLELAAPHSEYAEERLAELDAEEAGGEGAARG
jgi:TPR repeat protein